MFEVIIICVVWMFDFFCIEWFVFNLKLGLWFLFFLGGFVFSDVVWFLKCYIYNFIYMVILFDFGGSL